jgi:hypothetical protein
LRSGAGGMPAVSVFRRRLHLELPRGCRVRTGRLVRPRWLPLQGRSRGQLRGGSGVSERALHGRRVLLFGGLRAVSLRSQRQLPRGVHVEGRLRGRAHLHHGGQVRPSTAARRHRGGLRLCRCDATAHGGLASARRARDGGRTALAAAQWVPPRSGSTRPCGCLRVFAYRACTRPLAGAAQRTTGTASSGGRPPAGRSETPFPSGSGRAQRW